MEPKKLPPSMRQKSRYIVYEVLSEHPVEFQDFSNSVWNTVLGLLGELSASESRLWIIKNMYDAKAQRGIIKCNHDKVEHVRAALALVQIVGEVRCVVKILGVTGTIKSARNKYLGMADLRTYAGA